MAGRSVKPIGDRCHRSQCNAKLVFVRDAIKGTIHATCVLCSLNANGQCRDCLKPTGYDPTAKNKPPVPPLRCASCKRKQIRKKQNSPHYKQQRLTFPSRFRKRKSGKYVNDPAMRLYKRIYMRTWRERRRCLTTILALFVERLSTQSPPG